DVLKNLTDLRKALDSEIKRRDEQKKQPQQQQQQQKGQQTRRLVPPIAELKMLRNMQVEVNQRTKELYDAATVTDGKLTTVQQRMLARLTNHQSNIRDVLSKMNDALSEGQPGDKKDGDGGGKKDDKKNDKDEGD